MSVIKLVCFDLDGVLISSKETHYEALNAAIREVAGEEYVITRDEHLSTYDGLPTRQKLNMLTERKGLPASLHSRIAEEKQEQTVSILHGIIHPKEELSSLFASLRERGIKVAVCSNAVRRTVVKALVQLGVILDVDYVMSNEDVTRSKPHPEMYMRVMLSAGVSPLETLVVEDSHHGRAAAVASGSNCLFVQGCEDVTRDLVIREIDRLAFSGFTPASLASKMPWKDPKMNVLIPMAGAGSRFAAAGYTFPKPLIEVHGKPMIQVVVENLNIDANYIFVVQKEHYHAYNLGTVLSLIKPGCKVVITDGMTQGAACTALLAKEYIDNDAPLFFANSDQWVKWSPNEALYAFSTEDVDGGIITFKSTHPKWSFARVGASGLVEEVAEKSPISDEATVGYYYWKKGSDFVKYAEQMIADDSRVNNEFYVCPVFNWAIRDGKKIRIKRADEMWGLGTPEDLRLFLERGPMV